MKAKTDLIVGDRVAVYDNGVRSTGVVLELLDSRGRVSVNQDGGTNWNFHRKQLRKLVKKERAVVWKHPTDFEFTSLKEYAGEDWIKFKECK